MFLGKGATDGKRNTSRQGRASQTLVHDLDGGSADPAQRLFVGCIGYLVHPFKKVAPWAFIARLLLFIRWDSAIERVEEWCSCTRENRRVWAADHQGRLTMTLAEAYYRPLQTPRSQPDGPRPPA